MRIKLKAKESLQRIGDYTGQYRYNLSTDVYNKTDLETDLDDVAVRTGMNVHSVECVLEVYFHTVTKWITRGHSAPIPGLGTLRFGVRAKSVAKIDDVASDLIKRRRMVLTPCAEMREALRKTSIQIDCYDREGKLVKKVGSSDSGEVEEPDKTDKDTDNPELPGGSGGGSSSDDDIYGYE